MSETLIRIAVSNGGLKHDVEAHAEGCREIPVGFFVDTDTMLAKSSRDLWLDYNSDFLAEGGADNAWPIHFAPCCYQAGLVKDDDRTYTEEN